MHKRSVMLMQSPSRATLALVLARIRLDDNAIYALCGVKLPVDSSIVLDDFQKATGEDGWSAVTSFTIQCGNAVVETSDNTAVLTGLAPGTRYRCTVTANNSLGSGPALANFVTTSGSTGQLNIALICAATGKCGVS
jgi:hypothetical protein